MSDGVSPESSYLSESGVVQTTQPERTSASAVQEVGAEPPAEPALKAGQITSPIELFELAYSLEGRRVKLPQKILKEEAMLRALREAPNDAVARRMRELAVGDPLLAVPPRLLIGIEDAAPSARAKRRLAQLLAFSLGAHPLLGKHMAEAAGTEEHGDVASVFADIKSTSATIQATDLGPSAADKLKTGDREKLRFNAITTLALILSSVREWTVGELVEQLELHLWRDAARRPGARHPHAAVSEAQSPEALETVARAFMSKVAEADQKAAEAEKKVSEAENYSQISARRARAAEVEVERRDAELEVRKTEIDSLRDELNALTSKLQVERQERVIDRSHHADDYETLRTRVTRMLSRHTDLLSDGLHALRHGSHSVTEEYIERTLDAMTKELNQLREHGDGS